MSSSITYSSKLRYKPYTKKNTAAPTHIKDNMLLASNSPFFFNALPTIINTEVIIANEHDASIIGNYAAVIAIPEIPNANIPVAKIMFVATMQQYFWVLIIIYAKIY